MIEDIFNELLPSYRKGTFSKPTTFYFSVDELKKTLVFDADSCTLLEGKPEGEADCYCKTSMDMFLRIWRDGYRPGVGDFMSGAIKSSNPMLLPQLLQAFGR